MVKLRLYDTSMRSSRVQPLPVLLSLQRLQPAAAVRTDGVCAQLLWSQKEQRQGCSVRKEALSLNIRSIASTILDRYWYT
eukprot:9755-Heterococcus_DN1.PRE.1